MRTIIPETDSLYDLGTTTVRWANIYADNIDSATFSGGSALTKTDDTNVTLTLGGTPTTALLKATSITAGWTGVLAASRGGTGISALGTGVATALGVNVGTAGAFLVNGGALGTPSSGTVTNLTGTAGINITGTAPAGTLTGTTLASNVVTSSLTTIGTLTGLTVNSATITLSQDTNFVLSGGVNGLSFNTDTLSIDATNGRVGIGTTTPGQKLEVEGTAASDGIRIALDNTSSGASAEREFRFMEGATIVGRLIANSSGATNPYELSIRNFQNSDIAFYTNETGGGSTAKMFIQNDGNVGIGTTGPVAKLEVSGTGALIGTMGAFNVLGNLTDNAILTVGSGAANRLGIIELVGNSTVSNGIAGISMVHKNSSTYNEIASIYASRAGADNSGTIAFNTMNAGTAATRMTIQYDGNVGINDTTPDFKFDVEGTVGFPGISAGAAGDTDACLNATTNEVTDAGASTCIVSSLRFKENLKPLTGGLEKVLKLNPVSYNYKPNLDSSKVKKVRHIGLIAEEMLKVERRLVFFEADGKTPRGIGYEEFTALLTSAIKELNAKVDLIINENIAGIKKQIADLSARMLSAENRLTNLERENQELKARIKALEDGFPEK